MNLVIRSEAAPDIAAIEALTVAAFLDAPHASHTEQFIVNALRDAGQLTLSLVAEEAGRIVGHVAVSPVTLSDGSGGWYGLGPLSVAPARQRKGIGRRLMQQVLASLRALEATGCVVLGEPEYYGRFGFKADPALVLPGAPPAYFLALFFRRTAAAGTVTYHAAFGARG